MKLARISGTTEAAGQEQSSEAQRESGTDEIVRDPNREPAPAAPSSETPETDALLKAVEKVSYLPSEAAIDRARKESHG